MLKKWFISAFPEIEKISQTLAPNLCQKWWKIEHLMKKVHRIRKNLTEPCLAFSQHITMLKKWFISAFPEIERIFAKSGPKFRPKFWKLVSLMKRCIGSTKPHRSVFRFFARYYDAKEVIHKRISWNWEDISNSGPKVMPKMMKNWTFNEKIHRIRKTSRSHFSLFCNILRCWRSDS